MNQFLALPASRRRAIERAVEAGELTQEEIAREFSTSRNLVAAAALVVRAGGRRRT